jgi:hypothetical protein
VRAVRLTLSHSMSYIRLHISFKREIPLYGLDFF